MARWEGEVEEWEAVVESPCGYLARGSEELIEVAKISVFVCLPIMSFRVDQTTGYLGGDRLQGGVNNFQYWRVNNNSLQRVG